MRYNKAMRINAILKGGSCDGVTLECESEPPFIEIPIIENVSQAFAINSTNAKPEFSELPARIGVDIYEKGLAREDGVVVYQHVRQLERVLK